MLLYLLLYLSAIEISLNQTVYNVSEGNELTVCADIVSGSLERDVFATVDITEGTAINGE